MKNETEVIVIFQVTECPHHKVHLRWSTPSCCDVGMPSRKTDPTSLKSRKNSTDCEQFYKKKQRKSIQIDQSKSTVSVSTHRVQW